MTKRKQRTKIQLESVLLPQAIDPNPALFYLVEDTAGLRAGCIITFRDRYGKGCSGAALTRYVVKVDHKRQRVKTAKAIVQVAGEWYDLDKPYFVEFKHIELALRPKRGSPASTKWSKAPKRMKK